MHVPSTVTDPPPHIIHLHAFTFHSLRPQSTKKLRPLRDECKRWSREHIINCNPTCCHRYFMSSCACLPEQFMEGKLLGTGGWNYICVSADHKTNIHLHIFF